MKKILLTKGKYALVDDEDFAYLNQFKWYYHVSSKGKGYAAARMKRPRKKARLVYMHRIILHAPKNREVDHWNNCGLDNQKHNLRICTRSQNTRNRRSLNRNKTGYKGVYYAKTGNKWRAMIRLNGKNKHIGVYGTPKEAAAAYNQAAKKYYGEFACLNPL